MKDRTLFLRWSLVMSLTAIGIVIAAMLGWLGVMYSMDATKITILIALVFVGASVWCGFLASRLDEVVRLRRLKPADDKLAADQARLPSRPDSEELIARTAIDAAHGEYASGICMKLGLLGTVIGLTMTFLGAFVGFQATSNEAVQKLIEQLASGTATAFVTTIAGLVCSLALSLQYHLLRQEISRLQS